MGRNKTSKTNKQQGIALARLSNPKNSANKENIPTPPCKPRTHGPNTSNKWYPELRNSRRQNHRLRSQLVKLDDATKNHQSLMALQSQTSTAELKDAQRTIKNQDAEISFLVTKAQGSRESIGRLRKLNSALWARVRRMTKKLQALAQRDRLMPVLHKMKSGRTYMTQVRALTRGLILAGCSQQQAGAIIRMVGKSFGITVSHTISRRSVGRFVLEGGIAAKIQLGSEISHAKGGINL